MSIILPDSISLKIITAYNTDNMGKLFPKVSGQVVTLFVPLQRNYSSRAGHAGHAGHAS
jgi:hypothetical protein